MANNTFKRSIAMLLVLNMLTGMLPIQALADEGNTEAPAITVTVTPSESSSEKKESAPAEKQEAAPAEEKTESAPAEKQEAAPAEKTESAEVASYDDNGSAKIEHDSNLTFGEKVEVEVTKDPVTTETNEDGATVETETTHVTTEGTTDDGAAVKGKETFTETTTTTEAGTTVESVLDGEETTEESVDLGKDAMDVVVPVIPGVDDVEFEEDDVVVSNTETEKVKNEDGSTTETVTKTEEVTREDETTQTEIKTETSTATTTDKDGVIQDTIITEKVEMEEKVETKDGNTTTTETTTTTTNKTTNEAGDLLGAESNVIIKEETEVVTGDVQDGEDDTDFDFTTTTTTIIRDVTTEILGVEGEITTNFDSIVGPEDYEGKNYDTQANSKDNPQRDGIETPQVMVSPDQAQTAPEGEGYDFFLSGLGEYTDAAAPVFKHIVYQRDEDGNPIPDGNGGYLIDEEKSKLINGTQGKAIETGMDFQPGQLVLTYKDGEYFYAYCADYLVETDQEPGHRYTLENLEDSGHYSDEDAAQLRAIVSNAYWGNEEGKGSISNVKDLLTEYAEKNPKVTVKDKNGKDVEYDLADLIGNLKEHEALAVSQAAIWAYSINRQDQKDGVDKVVVVGAQSAIKCYNSKGGMLSEYMPANDQSVVSGLTEEEREKREAEALESDARMQALFDCLMNLTPIEETEQGVSTVINEKNAFDDVTLTVQDKVEEHENNKDDKDDNDVYNTDLNFTLAFVPDQKSDDLLVYILDAEGNKIAGEDGKPIVKRLAGENGEGEDYDKITADENGVYTLTGIQLSEGCKFDLTLEGTQLLKDGVYLYTADGGRLASQTLVGMAGGERDVKVSMSLKFEVDESKTVVATRKWRETGDPENTPRDNPPPPAEYRMGFGVGQLEVIEEEVPLAAPPQTGDMSILWFAMIVMSGCGLCILNLLEKRKCQA